MLREGAHCTGQPSHSHASGECSSSGSQPWQACENLSKKLAKISSATCSQIFRVETMCVRSR